MVGAYSMSVLVGYLTPNTVYIYIYMNYWRPARGDEW